MYRTAGLRLRSLEGRSGNFSARYATTAAVASRPTSSGFFSWLTGERSTSLPPMNIPLEGVPHPPSLPGYITPSETKITPLSNGVKIASEQLASPTASVGLYIDSGSVYETLVSSGASHLLERMAFKSTTNRSHLRVVREIEAIGGNTLASASREQMAYTADALKSYVPKLVEVLVDGVRNPAFLDWEVNEEMIVAEGIGRQILTYGERKPVEGLLKTVDEITLDDITSIGQKILSSPLTMPSYGDGNS